LGDKHTQRERTEISNPFLESRASLYSTNDFVDPDPFSTVASIPSISTRASSGVVRTIIFSASLRTNSTDSTTRVLDEGERIRVRLAGNTAYNEDSIVSTVTTTTFTDDTITYTGTTRLNESAVADATMAITERNTEGSFERSRQLLLYPSIFDTRTTYHVDYIKDLPVLVLSTDEPAMSLQDRIVLVFGALSRGWIKQRDPETFAANRTFFLEKLARMKAKLEDSTDYGTLSVSDRYLARKRTVRTRNRRFESTN